jgi:hypothetical protein
LQRVILSLINYFLVRVIIKRKFSSLVNMTILPAALRIHHIRYVTIFC